MQEMKVGIFFVLFEDPFTLESLDKLIKLHKQRNMDFIIARVTTVDPSDENKFYFSYYAGYLNNN